MELVYLWVEKYKNIHNQGFNFSPKFSCNYDKDTNELTIDENDDYVKNFFGENINVAAIVGKNGSGKSNILKFIKLFLSREKSIQNNYQGFLLFYDQKIDIYYCVYAKPEIFKCVHTNNSVNVKKIHYEDINSFPKIHSTVFPLFDYSLNNELSYLTQKTNNLQKILFPIFPDKDIGTINLDKINSDSIYNIIYNHRKLKEIDIFNSFFKPKYVEISINFDLLNDKNLTTEKSNKVDAYIKEAKDKFQSNSTEEAMNKIEKIFNIVKNENNYKRDPAKLNFPRRELNQIEKDFLVIKSDFYQKNLHENFKINTFDDQFNYQKIFKFDVDDTSLMFNKYFLNNFIEPFFKISIISDKELKLDSLSFGEQQLIKILNNIYYLGTKDYILKDIPDFIKDEDGEEHETSQDIDLGINNFIISLDEIDIGFHPDWQKRIIQYIIDFLELIPNKKFHLIFTTHSPFLLSDIPKQNIIFLDTDENGNCKVVDGLRDKKETFGANIHTLLSDSFFMEDGLMGEFAKGKIDDLINYLNGNKSTIKDNDEAQRLLNIIGEPIIKNQLRRMLDSNEIDKIKKDMRVLAKKLETLEERDNDKE